MKVLSRFTRLKFMIAVLLLVFMLPVAAQAHIAVLLYHKFDEADSPSTSVSSAMFAEQMKFLKDEGYRVLSMDELEDCLYGRLPVPPKAAVITIDDGYISEYTKAVPILREYGYPFSIFVFTHAVGRPGYMSWEQLREIYQYKGSVGCHSHTHPHLTDVSHADAELEYRLSKDLIEKNLGREVKWFALPFGDYDQEILRLGKAAGYTLLLTSDPGTAGSGARADQVPRQAIVGRNLTMAKFREKLERPPLEIVARYPEAGRIGGSGLDRIEITLAHPEEFYPGQIQMFVSEKGRIETTFDPQSGCLSAVAPITLSRKTNRISVTARRRTDGRYARHSYLIVLPEKTD